MSGVIVAIAKGAKDQATSLNQVNAAVSELDHGTQSSAAMVEQTTAAARSLSDQTKHLADLVALFRLEAADGRRLRAA
jgi:methyl-accepting chemotaxis protein